MNTIACPKCGESIEGPLSLLDETIKCPNCGLQETKRKPHLNRPEKIVIVMTICFLMLINLFPPYHTHDIKISIDGVEINNRNTHFIFSPPKGSPESAFMPKIEYHINRERLLLENPIVFATGVFSFFLTFFITRIVKVSGWFVILILMIIGFLVGCYLFAREDFFYVDGTSVFYP